MTIYNILKIRTDQLTNSWKRGYKRSCYEQCITIGNVANKRGGRPKIPPVSDGRPIDAALQKRGALWKSNEMKTRVAMRIEERYSSHGRKKTASFFYQAFHQIIHHRLLEKPDHFAVFCASANPPPSALFCQPMPRWAILEPPRLTMERSLRRQLVMAERDFSFRTASSWNVRSVGARGTTDNRRCLICMHGERRRVLVVLVLFPVLQCHA